MQKKKNGMIELLRFVFCLAVVLVHTKVFWLNGERVIFGGGFLAVDFFFIVSGYLMARSIGKLQPLETGMLGKETQHFLGRKFAGLMPNLAVSWCIGFAVMLSRELPFGLSKIWLRLCDVVWETAGIHMAGFGTWRVNGADWYISAMLLSMLVLYPLCRKYGNTFVRIIAPAAALGIFGYFMREFTSPGGTYDIIGGVFYMGLLRSAAGICLGCASVPLVDRIASVNWNTRAKALVSLTEVLLLCGILAYMQFKTSSRYSMLVVASIWLLTVLAFSHQGPLAQKLDHPVCYVLGKYSLSVYLAHVYWAHWIGTYCSGCSHWIRFGLYLVLAFATSLVIFFVSEALKKLRIGDRVRRFLTD